MTPGGLGDVLVVGAGPTGLTLAAALHRGGVRADVVERLREPSTGSKAVAINAATQLCFNWLGLSGAVGTRARRVNQAHVYCGLDRIAHVDTRVLPSTLSSFLVQPQWVTEAELRAELQRADVPLWFGHEVTALEDNQSRVRVQLKDAAGALLEKDYRYVVGCDGKHSVVRAAMGVSFEGPEYQLQLALADMPLARAIFGEAAHYHVFDQDFVIVVPLPGDQYRVVLQHNRSHEAGVDIAAVLRERFGATAVTGATEWRSNASLYMSVAGDLRKGRLLIAGDAAHLYSPIGGTGMNTGIQDAWNLGWKLAYGLRDAASAERLLASYAAERAHATRVGAAGTDLLTRLISRTTTDQAAVDALLPLAKHSRPERAARTARLTGISQQYPEGDYVWRSPDPDPQRAGSLAWFVESHDHLRRARERALGWKHLLILRAPTGQEAAFEPWLRACSGVAAIEVAAALRIEEAEPSAEVGAPACGTATLVRPDGCIAFCNPLEDTAPLGAYLTQLFGTTPTADATQLQRREYC